MAYTGIIHPVVLIPFLAAQTKALQAVVQFKRDKASTSSAKHVKKTQYAPFTILLIGFLGTTAYKRFEKRREKD